MKYQRRRIWIDRFQTYLSLRIALYFVFYQISVWSIVAIERASSASLAELIGPAANTSFLLLIGVAELFLSREVSTRGRSSNLPIVCSAGWGHNPFCCAARGCSRIGPRTPSGASGILSSRWPAPL